MLICPHCKFENPNSNKFCQNCGTSLTHKVCPKCAAEVALNTQYCYNCGAECGTVWLAIIAKNVVDTTQKEEIEQLEQGIGFVLPALASSLKSEQPQTTLALLNLSAGSYLDPQQRYQLLESLPREEDIGTEVEVSVRVLDCQPYEVSPLSAILENQQKGLATTSLDTDGISDLAKRYIALQSHHNLGIPTIHDAWQHQDIQVVLIEDRSNWQHLLELWRQDTTSSLQIVHCFYQMTQLWGLLETINCRQSLLEWSNLRLDEDQAVALQRLYAEPQSTQIAKDLYSITNQSLQEGETQTASTQDQPFSIKTLGRVWQTLFKQSQRTQFGSILQLLGDIELGKFNTLKELQVCLQAIAVELEENSTPVDNSSASPTILQLDEKEESASKSDDVSTVVLPMQLVSLENAGLTNVGRQRDHNEDYFGIETEINKVELPNNRTIQARGLYILCDGMGGHAGGEVASALAVDSLRQYFKNHWVSNQLPTEDQIREAVRQANRAIYDMNQQDARSGLGRMGTTLIILLIQGTQVAVAHVGDSRLYRLTRKKELEQITTDHEVGQREISRGIEPNVAYSRPDAYQLTQALGPRDENFIAPDVQFLEIDEDTLFLLASDGLSDNELLESHWRTHLQPLLNSGTSLENGVSDLIDLANNYNGHDNITAVVIRAKVRPSL
ncbi:serine/threonine phosphatase [Aetokthonos hydrillicola Thurmond2011]|jgi:protein phosphatase|uniref:Serine/threonine phosphatase n=1 Tax=Aetokthonos hydrillicola Thurmond2011 TaxID=2712845 RepID=A0AAP5M9L9_9CYAN|nr:serine/threonine phosphatase [Aetokthonos hydrillicola]MBO3461892.1 serine/threonine phosphatase [Aetokthonos hydrillicola CCALA 1050]MBW4586766.1 serine/threonine phosphatase [Aetokthonos hydrillicola CCALA 1050]MDR9895877.1 serine/threonine phosphatase [Aetokthonos hydrillicola Thurmond2011]